MYRLIAILLIPFFVVGNSLAHSHGTVAHPSPSQGRAHFHLVGHNHQVPGHNSHGHNSHGHSHHGHSHHGHSHDHESDDSKSAPGEQPVDHDSDAVYIVAPDFVVAISARILIETGSFGVFETVEDCFAGIWSSARCGPPRPATTTELPFYLLQAALRL